MGTHTVTEDEQGQRLDRLIKKIAPSLPHGLIQKLLRTKGIRVNSHRAKGDDRVAAGDLISWPDTVVTQEKAKAEATPQDKAFMQDIVLFDDDDFLILNKPKGLATQGGTNLTQSVDTLLGAMPNAKGVKPRLVHRLDKDTSGVLLTARSADIARKMAYAFQGREMEKLYLAIVDPEPRANKGVIEARLKKAGKFGEERMVVADDGDPSTTRFEVLDRRKKRALVLFKPETGRMHQIRLHAAHMGMPLLGDVKYGGKPHEYGLHLHAFQLSFKHPDSGYGMLFHAPLPDGFVATMKAYGLSLPEGM